jgi:hypothetical protein
MIILRSYLTGEDTEIRNSTVEDIMKSFVLSEIERFIENNNLIIMY